MSSVTRRFTTRRPVNLDDTLGPLLRGSHDPCVRVRAGAWWLSRRTPEGPGTLRLHVVDGALEATAWGPGASWCVEQAPELLGDQDDLGGFQPAGAVLALHRRHPGLRIPRTLDLMGMLLRLVLEQKVVGKEAGRAYNVIVRGWGEPAPGPEDLWLVPTAERLSQEPYYAYHPFGVEQKRATTIRHVASRASFLAKLPPLPPAEAVEQAQLLHGIGPWTAGELGLTALGDVDAVPVGDFHLPNTVTYALTGEHRGDDARMLELLAPYRGHRGRVIRLIAAAGISAPRHGPRQPLRNLSRL